MPAGRQQQGPLRLVHTIADRFERSAWFCGRCAQPSRTGAPPAPSMRVCSNCGLGLLLETRVDLVPSPADAFIVVDSQLAIEAVSAQAERVLAVSERDVVHLPLHSLISPAGIDSAGEYGLTAAVMEAATGSDQLSSVFVRPRNTFGVRVRARIGACGPPRAALIVLDAERPPLRAV